MKENKDCNMCEGTMKLRDDKGEMPCPCCCHEEDVEVCEDCGKEGTLRDGVRVHEVGKEKVYFFCKNCKKE